MCSPVAGSKILYRNSRLLRMAFLQLHRQQRADVFCDVILQAEGEAVPAHCCILSACSPFFMECLERQMPSKGCKVVLELRGLKIGTLRKLVDFLYTSEMEVSREEARDILAAARQFQVAELESLQLEGGKLVKQVLGRRLNRKCLQPPSLAPISARVVPQACPPAPTTPQTFHPLVAGKQLTAKPPGDGGVCASSTTCQAESAKYRAAVVPQNGGAQPGMQGAVTPVQPVETGNVSTKSRSLGSHRSLSVGRTLGEAEGSQGERSAEQAFPSEGCATDCSPQPRKIKLSRLKLPPPHNAGATKAPPTAAPSKTPTSIRRLWQQKTPGWDEAGGLEQGGPSCPAGSLPVPPKTSNRKRSSSASASGSDTTPEEGHVGSVKLRKVVNGSCWEVVQEPPAREPQGAPVTMGETGTSRVASPPSARPHNFTRRPELPETRAASSTELLAGRLEAAPLPEQVTVEQGPSAGRGGCRDPYELDMAALEPLSENEEFGDSAPLEQMLDLLLSGSGVEGLGTAGPGGTAGCAPSMGPSRGPNTTPVGAEAAGEEWHPPEVQLWPEWDDPGKGPLPGWEVGGGHSALSTADGDPLGQPVGGHLAPRRALSSGGHPSSWSPVPLAPASPQTPQHPQLAAGSREVQSAHVPAEDSTGKGQGLCTTQAAGMETRPQFQAPWGLPRSSPKHGPLDHQPPDSPEGDEIDIMAGAEEALVPAGITCVRPDPSSESDEEVDILN
ncbi:BTB/POZ domain-containing protein 18 isoform X1 [Mauremys reevesii]|uniref:BTB/POZ domain-containing protein 18 isoform X1 n=2 Tax=Mauremys reevesii TaxID=260615 RepID=UPI00193F50B6|nr:BTB/POZ domain-containing protein 18 isoform X1 [Mauremys reevesii]XP_039391340.1 BTB/POZ domain-containing protein 18 isoform X1 [Mauremys reevesii]XP_039391341.1 BTB/POZ domain-containing protein 18 isoform X1 [Mauremys reevesii]XP_039391342.1 BTB/POZ domain-containing protein 18 isoform X1 [Mauremys reevesii]XP_039391343.1 BTB/POZ domain-containing protein 18 isoform X1 [Mauremys reevesii]XP_039391345.1 BTB/POZ domain-containing protein 18 isoform X1 [Mauremys reevesii]XP_039391346.1 BT